MRFTHADQRQPTYLNVNEVTWETWMYTVQEEILKVKLVSIELQNKCKHKSDWFPSSRAILRFTVTHFDVSAYLYGLPGKEHVHWIASGPVAPIPQSCLFVYSCTICWGRWKYICLLMLQWFLSGPRECYRGEANKHLLNVIFKSSKCRKEETRLTRSRFQSGMADAG